MSATNTVLCSNYTGQLHKSSLLKQPIFPKLQKSTFGGSTTHLSSLIASASITFLKTCATGTSPAYPVPQPRVLDRSLPVPRGKTATWGMYFSCP